MKERVCKNCGGKKYKVVGQNMLKCSFCGTLYVDEQASKEEEVLLVGANEMLREVRFDDAVAEFDKIISLFPRSFEGYFGRALARNKIVLYNNQKGTKKTARFFEEIPNLSEDEDFKKAVDFAPSEVAKTYLDQAKRIEKCKANAKTADVDVFVCADGFDKTNPSSQILKIEQFLQESGIKSYFVQNLDKKEKEEETFMALCSCKVFLYFVGDPKAIYNGEIKNLYDRYLYFISKRQKSKSSFVLLVENGQMVKALPKELAICKKVIDLSSISFLQDVETIVSTEMEKTLIERARIEKRKIDKVEPQKKENVDFESVNPHDLGNYEVENVTATETSKIKWVFLLLKNGDFQSANELIEKELQALPNNSELLFAKLMSEKKIKTEEEFFSSIGNFQDREKLDKILDSATREFAENFVDRWETLVESIDDVDYYNEYLLYLAKFNSQNRQQFIEKAEAKAVESLDEQLIEKVLKCFASTDVDKFVNFYFVLAQKTGDNKYYEKILQLDEGHEQSQIAVFLQNFKTSQDMLNFQNRDEFEQVLGFMAEQKRDKFICSLINMLLPISFIDIEKAEKQLDFYFSYLSQDEVLVSTLKKVAQDLQEKGFFRLSEKYLAVAISKNSNDAELYWELLKSRAHCRTNNDVVLTNVKILQMPEWESLLSVANEEQTEKYAEIISKSNLYSGERKSFASETLDKKNTIEKLKVFLIRNDRVLLDAEKQGAVRATAYFKSQLKPLEKYIIDFEKVDNFIEYEDLIGKLNLRLDSLNLTIDSTISSLHLSDREDDMKNVFKSTKEVEQKIEKTAKSIKNDIFLKRYLFVFFEIVPLLFSTVLFAILLANPKEIYMNFNHTFLVIMLLISVLIGVINLCVYFAKKKTMSLKQKVNCSLLVVVAFLNLILFAIATFFMPKDIEINTAKEFRILTKNASESNLVLTTDLDFENKTMSQASFGGMLDGKGYKLTNVKFSGAKDFSLFKRNTGEISNLEIYLSEDTYSSVKTFGGIVLTNLGKISNCNIHGSLNIEVSQNANLGGVCATLAGGTIENCHSDLTFTIEGEAKSVTLGGLTGIVKNRGKETKLVENITTLNIDYLALSEEFVFGGLIGDLEKIDTSDFGLYQNESTIAINGTGGVTTLKAGGLVGTGRSGSKNNFATGTFDFSNMQVSGYVGGLYGEFVNRSQKIEYSYSTIEILATQDSPLKVGSLVGIVGGDVANCFSSLTSSFQGADYGTIYLRFASCFKGDELNQTYYDSRLGFDENVWIITNDDYPKLK